MEIRAGSQSDAVFPGRTRNENEVRVVGVGFLAPGAEGGELMWWVAALPLCGVHELAMRQSCVSSTVVARGPLLGSRGHASVTTSVTELSK